MVEVTWAELRNSLEVYEREALPDALRAALEDIIPEPPRELSDEQYAWKNAALDTLQGVIDAHTGVWGQLFPVGHEMISPYCICHSFFGYQTTAPTRTQIAEEIPKIVAEVDKSFGLMTALAPIIEGDGESRSAGEEVRELREAMLEVFAVVIDITGCHESWYRVVECALAWVLEQRGVKMEEDVLEGVMSEHFSSWTVNQTNVTKVADLLTEHAVKTLFAERYGV